MTENRKNRNYIFFNYQIVFLNYVKTLAYIYVDVKIYYYIFKKESTDKYWGAKWE